MRYVDYVYDIVRLDCEGMDSIYKDYIIQMVGVYGFNTLYQNNLIEGCGVINGRQLYVLCERKKGEKKWSHMIKKYITMNIVVIVNIGK